MCRCHGDHHNIELCGGNILGLCLYNPSIKALDEISRIYLVHYQFLDCGYDPSKPCNPAQHSGLGILNGPADDAGYDVTSYRPDWVVPRCHTASTMRAFNNSFEAFFCDHSPPAFISPRPRDQSRQLSVQKFRCRLLPRNSLADLESYHPSPRHYGCQGYRRGHREYLLNPLKFNGEHKSGMPGMWNTILFLWRQTPPVAWLQK